MGTEKVIRSRSYELVGNVSLTTGSGEVAPAIFIDGNSAFNTYGATKRYANGCPHCRGPTDALLSFNPFNGYWYLAPCPICGNFIRYYDNLGNLSDFQIMKSNKMTLLDQDLNVEDRYDY